MEGIDKDWFIRLFYVEVHQCLHSQKKIVVKSIIMSWKPSVVFFEYFSVLNQSFQEAPTQYCAFLTAQIIEAPSCKLAVSFLHNIQNSRAEPWETVEMRTHNVSRWFLIFW